VPNDPYAKRRDWDRALRTYVNSDLKYKSASACDLFSEKTAVLHRQMDFAKDQLLLHHAPDLEAVVRKLQIIWGDLLMYEDDSEAAAMRRIIIDLRRLNTTLPDGEPNEWDVVLGGDEED
jgi:hypothetical protein